MSQRADRLTTSEAVDLAHALAAYLAETAGIRVVFIKGPSLAHHSLRAPRVSSDADVVADPAQFGDFIDLLAERGWRERPATMASRAFAGHSVTLVRPDWPCDLDVHVTYPGMLKDPSLVFEALWTSREYVRVANIQVPITGFGASAVVMGLHSMRGSVEDPRHQAELADLRMRSSGFTDQQRDDVTEAARGTGAVSTLGALLHDIGRPSAPEEWELSSAALLDWRRRTASGSVGTYFWIKELIAAPWRRKAAVAFRAAWPTRADVAINNPSVGHSTEAVTAFRLKRLARGFVRVPRIAVTWAAAAFRKN